MLRIFIEDFLIIYNIWFYVVDWFNIIVFVIILGIDIVSDF